MQLILKFAVCILITGMLLFISCQKELSCENCRVGNTPPISKAGPDQVITLPTDSVTLDGSASSDPDGTISEWLWTKISGPASFTISIPTDSMTRVKLLIPGIYLFELKVTDNVGLSSKDTISVIVDTIVTTNHPPVANAGTDKTITLPTDSVTVNGSGSTDIDNNITSYGWTKISGPSTFNIANAGTIQTQIINLIEGVYLFELEVTDAGGLFSKDTIQIKVNPLPLPPPTGPGTCAPGNRPLVQAQLIPIGTLSQSRFAFAIGAAGNKIVIAGGWVSPGNAVPSSTRADIYDITTGAWATAELSAGRFGSGVAVLGNKIFFGGGGVQQDNGWGAWQYAGLGSSAIDIYDVSTNSWTTAQLSTGRAPTGASAGNKVVFAGGDDMAGSDRIDIYDASVNAWTAAILSDEKHIRQVAVSGTKIFLAGGSAGLQFGGNYISGRIDIFDAAANTWTVDNLSKERGQMGAISVNNKIYWGGGVIASTDPSIEYVTTNSVEIRDLVTNTTSFECLSEPKTELTAVRKDNRIIFFGGLNSRFDIYDLTTHSWSIGVLPQNLRWASVISHDNTIYVAGGEINGVLSNQVWRLEF